MISEEIHNKEPNLEKSNDGQLINLYDIILPQLIANIDGATCNMNSIG